MKLDMDTIQFEYRAEVQELMNVVGKYVSEHPEEKNNQTLKEFYEKLDVMDMSW